MSFAYTGKTQPFPSESFTFTELSDALRRLGYADFTTEQHARRIYNDIIDHREPKWAAGDIVRSDTGTVFTRLSTDNWRNELDGATVSHKYPTRPLKKIGRTV